ncbi:MAG TPA: ABC transporter permease [Gemmata sp.]
MQQFFAILKDSFREAVDGFVIYAMLVMALLAIVLIGSLSFTPAEPKPAFDRITGYFEDAVINGGRLRHALRQNARFRAEDVRPEGNGFKLRLVVSGQPSRTFTDEKLEEIRKEEAKKDGKKDEPKKDEKKDEPKKPDRVDGFRELVLIWQKTNPERNELPFMRETPVALSEVQGVSDAQMEAYIKRQFEFHAGMNVTVTRAPGAAEPEYAFDVTTLDGTSVRGWPHKVNILFNTFTWPTTQSLGETVYWIQDKVVNGFGAALALLISLVLTSFYIPNLLRKGSLDLLISKPIGRSQLLIYKYIGGLTFIFLLTTFTVFGVWVALAARSGIWDPTFLVVIPVLTFTFAILYAVSVLAAVLTRSAIVSILVSVAFAMFLYVVGFVKTVTDTLKADEQVKKEMPGWVFTLVDALNNILPRYKDLDKLTTKLLSASLTQAELRDRGIDVLDYPSWGSTISMSVLFIAVTLGLACWRLSRRDG